MLNPLPVKTHVKGNSEAPFSASKTPIVDEKSSAEFESAVHAAMREKKGQSSETGHPSHERDIQQVGNSRGSDNVDGRSVETVGQGGATSGNGESTPSGILLAETGLQGSESMTVNGEQAFRQLMPLLGGDELVDPALSRFHGTSAVGGTGSSAEPLMTQPLQDAIVRVGQTASPSPLDPLSGMAVQELLDPKAIEAKNGLRRHALASPNVLLADDLPKGGSLETGGVVNAVSTPLEQGLRQLMAEPKGGNGLSTEAPMKPLGPMNPGSPALEQSAPWLGVEPERNFVADAPLAHGERLLATPIPLAPIEHALLTADIRNASAPQLTESAKHMAGNAPTISPEQTAPWARSLLEAVSPAGVHANEGASTSVQETLGPQGEPPLDASDDLDVDLERPQTSFRASLASGDGGRQGFRSALTATATNPSVTDAPVTAHTPTAELDGPRPSQALKASIQAQTMTPQMAMASDDVAEFTVVKPDQMEVRIQDIEGELELSVAREDDGLSVKVRAPKEIIEDFQDMRGDVETALSEDGEELSSFDAEANDTSAEESSTTAEGSGSESEEEVKSTPSIEGLGARVLSRLV